MSAAVRPDLRSAPPWFSPARPGRRCGRCSSALAASCSWSPRRRRSPSAAAATPPTASSATPRSRAGRRRRRGRPDRRPGRGRGGPAGAGAGAGRGRRHGLPGRRGGPAGRRGRAPSRPRAALQAAADQVAAAAGADRRLLPRQLHGRQRAGPRLALLDVDGPGELVARAATAGLRRRPPGRRPRRAGGRAGAAGGRRRRRPLGPRREGGGRGRPRRRPRPRPTGSSRRSRPPYERSPRRRRRWSSSCRPRRCTCWSCRAPATPTRRGWRRRRPRRPPPGRPRRPPGAGPWRPRQRGGADGGGATAAAVGGDTSGRPRAATTSCFGGRWGVTHYGVDIAAPIGTPIYAATAGVVQRAGTATGFGCAVYIRGDDGAVTVYGHVNQYFVAAGERVAAGEQIAEVGNRGQSTGPHLHFEVHPSGAHVRRPGRPGAVAAAPAASTSAAAG